MVVFIVFLLVITLWIGRSVVIISCGPNWFIELNHGDTVPQVDKALKTIKTVGLVFIAFVAPLMFAADSIAAFLLYMGALKQSVKEAETAYLIAEAELAAEEANQPTPSVP